MKNRLAQLAVLLVMMTACLVGRGSSPPPTPQNPLPAAALTVRPQDPTPLPATSIPQPTLTPTPTAVPTWNWPRSTPEEQGISSAGLAALLEEIQREQRPIHSILVIRNGVLVLEAYAHPYGPEIRQNVYSTTKSITGILVGMAVDDSLLSVDDRVVDYFPQVVVDDARKQDIRVAHLLAMNSGIEWMEPLHSGLSDLWGIIEADDPAQYFFSPALVETPGTVFNYNSGGSHLCSILVQQVGGQTAASFARERLFAPLGITDIAWQSDFSGHSIGGTGLQMRPVDMAKIGQLYLDEGRWQGEQIVSAGWVSESTTVQSQPQTRAGYGYQWWIRPEGDYYSLGWGGQQIRVFPDRNLVVVFTAGESDEYILKDDLVDTYLLPAVQADEPLPSDPQGQTRLADAVEAFSGPHLWPSRPESPIAGEVDGKQWLVTGMGAWSMFSLRFENETEGAFDLTVDGDPMHLALGLDGIYRVTDTTELGPVALAGYWENDDSFVVIQKNLRDADLRMTTIHFDGDRATLYSVWSVDQYEEETEAELFGL